MSTRKKTLFVVLLYMVLVMGYVAAATSGTLVIRAYVPEVAEVQMLTNTGIQYLDIDSGTALVGTIKEKSTKETGYNVEITSMNATQASSDDAYLVGGNTGERMPYYILYGGEAVGLNRGSATIPSSAGLSDGQIMVACDSVESGQGAQNYSDTLMLSIIAN